MDELCFTRHQPSPTAICPRQPMSRSAGHPRPKTQNRGPRKETAILLSARRLSELGPNAKVRMW